VSCETVNDSESVVVQSVVIQHKERPEHFTESHVVLHAEDNIRVSRWVLKGEFSLVYLSPDGELRMSSTNSEIIYGMRDNMRFREMFWPLFMLNNY